VAVVLLAAFAVLELRVASAPLVPFGLFRSRSVTGANLVMLLVGAAFFSFWYFVSLYLQNVLGFSALRAGMAFLPMAVAIMIAAQVSSRLLPRVGVRPLLIAGTLMAAGGFLWLAQIHAHSTYWVSVFGPGVLVSSALGVLFTPLASAATAGVSPAEAGLASGVLNTSRQMGGSLGLAVLATVATARSHSLLHAGRTAAPSALTSGYSRAFVLGAILALAGLLSSAIVPSIRARTAPVGEDRSTAPEPAIDRA
jgi:predicted MFS family arabinose efflux permease